MSANTRARKEYLQHVTGLAEIPDVLTTGTLDAIGVSGGFIPLITLTGGGTETRNLADPASANQRLLIYLHTNAATGVNITAASDIDEAGNDSLDFTAVGQFVDLVSVQDVAGGFAWRVVGYDGITGPSLDFGGITADSLLLSSTLVTTGATTLLSTVAAASTFTLSDGGTQTQITSKATTVVLSTNSGQITTHNAELAGAAEVNFTVTNTVVAATDAIIVNLASGESTGSYIVSVAAVAAGSFDIKITNVGSTASEVLVINFAVIGGSAT